MVEKHLCRTSCGLSDALSFICYLAFICLNIFLNYVTSEGAVSQNVLYYEQLSIACYQVSFYAYKYVEES